MKQRMEKEELDTESYCQMKKDTLCVWREMMAHVFSVFWLALREKVLKQYISKERVTEVCASPQGTVSGHTSAAQWDLYASSEAWLLTPSGHGPPWWCSWQRSCCQSRRHKRCRFIPLSREGLLEEVMTTHSSILAWRGPWTEEPHGLYSTG